MLFLPYYILFVCVTIVMVIMALVFPKKLDYTDTESLKGFFQLITFQTPKKKELVVWVGGSFMPPTREHFNMILYAIESLIRLRIDNGEEGVIIRICVVPVSGKYKKESIEKSSPEVRLRLLKAFIQDLKNHIREEEIPSVEIEMCLHEFYADKPMPTFESIQHLKSGSGNVVKKIYVLQGWDNVLSIAKREWFKSISLLENGILAYPRGHTYNSVELAIRDLTKELTEALTSHSGKEREQPLSYDNANHLLSKNLVFIGINKGSDISSTLVRRLVNSAKRGSMAPLRNYLTPYVLDELRKLLEENSDIFSYQT